MNAFRIGLILLLLMSIGSISRAQNTFLLTSEQNLRQFYTQHPWSTEEFSEEEYSGIKGVSPDGIMNFEYREYGGIPVVSKEKFDALVKEFSIKTSTAQLYTKETVGSEGQAHFEYFVTGYGVYSNKKVGMVIGCFYIDNTNCVAIFYTDPSQFPEYVQYLKNIIGL